MATMFQIIQFLDGNGDPYDSGEVYWFQAGTSTPKTTWVDEAESSPASHPVDLDSDGRPDHGSGPAAMWLRGSYKMVLKDKDGNTIITIDNINLYDQLDWTGLTATIADLNSTSTEAIIKTSVYTVVAGDRGKTILANATSASFVINLPSAATVGNKFKIIIKKIDISTNIVTITPSGSQTIDDRNTYILNDIFDFIEIHSDGSKWHVVSSQIRGTVRTINGAVNLTLRDNKKLINCDASGGAFGIGLPNATTGVGRGWWVTIKKIDSSTANNITITPTGGQTIDGASNLVLKTQYSSATLKSDGTNWYVVNEYGDVSSAGVNSRFYLREFELESATVGASLDAVKFNIGEARGLNNLLDLALASALTKRFDSNWAVGNNNGGFPSTATRTTSTFYRCFIIGKPDGTVDAGFDEQGNSDANKLLTDATGYTDYVQVGWIRSDSTDSSKIKDFWMYIEDGGRRETWWKTPAIDVNDNPPLVGLQTATLTAPPETTVILHYFRFSTDFDYNETLIRATNISGTADSHKYAFSGQLLIKSDSNRQIKYQATATGGGLTKYLLFHTEGWME